MGRLRRDPWQDRSIKGVSMCEKVKRQVGLRSRKHSSESSLHLTIIYHRIDELKPDPANPRCHSKRQVQQIGNSISAFGFNVPILIDRDNNVIAGHWRLLRLRRTRYYRGANVM